MHLRATARKPRKKLSASWTMCRQYGPAIRTPAWPGMWNGSCRSIRSDASRIGITCWRGCVSPVSKFHRRAPPLHIVVNAVSRGSARSNVVNSSAETGEGGYVYKNWAFKIETCRDGETAYNEFQRGRETRRGTLQGRKDGCRAASELGGCGA